MTVELITAIAPYITALVGLLSGVYAVSRANSNQLTSTYFSRMTAAYENHWAAFAEFVYYPNDKTRNAYVVAVYNAVLYSSEDAANGIQALFHKAIEYTRSGQSDARQLDKWAGDLEVILHNDVLRFRERGSR